MGRIEYFYGDLATGRIQGTLPLVGSSWNLALDQAGGVRGSLKLGDPDVAHLGRAIAPGKSWIGAAWIDDQGGETWLEAGPVWTAGYVLASRTLTLGAAGVWSYYDHRRVLPVLAATDDPATLTSSWSGVSLGTIAKRLVQLAHSHTGGSLPVVLPADVAGTEARTYPGYELATVGQRLTDLTREDGGPEIAFVPRRSAADSRYLEWAMQVGTPTAPFLTQPGNDWVFDATVPAGIVSEVTTDVDGTAMASRAWATGSGSGESRLITWVDNPHLTSLGWPLLETEDEGHDTVEDLPILTSYAGRLALTSQAPWQTLAVQLDPRGWPAPGQYRPGHWAQLVLPDNDPYLRPGASRCRIVSITGDGTGKATVQFQTELGS